MNKIYKKESSFSAKCCFLAGALIIFASPFVIIASGIARKFMIACILIQMFVGIALVICGFVREKPACELRKFRRNAKEKGVKCEGTIVNINKRFYNFDQRIYDVVSFVIQYYSPSENKVVLFETPALVSCTYKDTEMNCNVYEYNGKAIADDFSGVQYNRVRIMDVIFAILFIVSCAFLIGIRLIIV